MELSHYDVVDKVDKKRNRRERDDKFRLMRGRKLNRHPCLDLVEYQYKNTHSKVLLLALEYVAIGRVK